MEILKHRDPVAWLRIILNSTMWAAIIALCLATTLLPDERFFYCAIGVAFGWLIAHIYGEALKEYYRRALDEESQMRG